MPATAIKDTYFLTVGKLPRMPGCSSFFKDPAILIQELHGTDHSVANAEFRLPTHRSHAAAIEQDVRAVAYPSTIPTGIAELWRDIQLFANPSDRIVHLAGFIGAKV